MCFFENRLTLISSLIGAVLLLPPWTTQAQAAPSAEGAADDAPPQPDVAPDSTADDTIHDEAPYEVVVVSRRAPEEPFLSARSISVVNQRALVESSPRTTPEALWDSAGVFVQETNYGGGSPILRGLVGPRNLILVDGVRLNNSVYRTGPLQYLNLIDPMSLRRIEVLRGPGSVLYGSDAMGGVINLLPLVPELQAPGEIGGGVTTRARFSSADRGIALHGDGNMGYGGTSALGGVTYKNMHDVAGGRGVGVQPFSGYSDLSALAGLHHRIRSGPLDGWSAKVVYLSSRIEDAGRTDKLWQAGRLSVYDNADDLVYGRLHMDLGSLETTADLTASYQRFFERKADHAMADDLRTKLSTTEDETTVDTLGVDLQLETALLRDDRLQFVYGGAWYRDWIDADRRIQSSRGAAWQGSPVSNYPEGSTYDNYGAFVNLQGDPLKTKAGHVLRLSAGWRLHGMSGQAPAREELPSVDISARGNIFQGGLQYIFKDAATAALTYSQGFRAPNLNEAVMLGDTGKYFHIPNDDLAPERLDTVELLARGRFFGFTLRAAGYVSFIHDLIKREETTWRGQETVGEKPVARNVNGGEGLLFGVEGALGLELDNGISTGFHFTYTWGEERVGGLEIPLTRIPPLFGGWNLRYDTQHTRGWRAFIGTDIRAALDQDRLSKEDEKDVRIPDGGTPGWFTWNAMVGASIGDHLELGLRVENLLDTKYKYHGSGIWASGTNALLTAAVTH